MRRVSIPPPSRIISVIVPAISAHSGDDYQDRQALSRCGIDNLEAAPLDRAREMAQPIARAFLSCDFRCAWRSLFQTLGRSETFWNNSLHWRGAHTCASVDHAGLHWRRRCAPRARIDAPCCAPEKLIV